MARITVEDCLEKISNRFELVLVATKRARQLTAGTAVSTLESKDKPTVHALREIASGLVDRSLLEEIHVPDPLPQTQVGAVVRGGDAAALMDESLPG